jgi:EAL domain-containing protein (putative c-di-GMP-specific phosphodiesterase class I)
MTIVAEGVETADQETFLRDQACDEMQGFLFGKPVPQECVPDLLRAPLRVSPRCSLSRSPIGAFPKLSAG